MSTFQSFRSVQSQLYKERRCFQYSDTESIVKGDVVLTNRNRILLFTSNDHLDLLSRSGEILVFCICKYLQIHVEYKQRDSIPTVGIQVTDCESHCGGSTTWSR